MISVLLADDHEIVRAGLKRVLEEAGDIKVITEAADGSEALRKFKTVQPDVAIVDISMPAMDGIDTCKQIIASCPDAKVLILTMHPEEQYALRLFKAGALGYITKGSSTRELHEAVRSVSNGRKFLFQKGKDTILTQLLDRRGQITPLEILSDRELQVLRLLTRGDKMREIAATLNLSIKTVETYRARLIKKLDLRNNTDLIHFAHQNNLI
jgi:DNA-binding NarL/FixJ family response regulator